jgi:RsiW-degrading membrane proteinase PrsW (M82 family)
MDSLPAAHTGQENHQPPSGGWRSLVLVVAVALGLGAFSLLTTASLCGLVLSLVRQRRIIPEVTLPLFSLVAMGIGLGLPLAWEAATGLRGQLSRRFALSTRVGEALFVLYVFAVAGGQAVVSLKLIPSLTLPLFHVVALALPPLLLLWGAAMLAQDRFTWRQLIGGLGGGAFGAAGLAFAAELTLAIVGILIAMIVVGALPDGAAILRRMETSPGNLNDPMLLRSLLRRPSTIVTLFVSLGFVVPLIEEPIKSILPALAGTWQRLTPARGFLWGVATGAGFAIFEGLLNGGLNTGEWGIVAVSRVGSTAMHCFATGLTGWGWGEVWARRKWLRLVLAYTISLTLHGLWNSLSVGIAVVSAVVDQVAVQNALVAVAAASLIFLALGAIIALLWMARRLANREPCAASE